MSKKYTVNLNIENRIVEISVDNKASKFELSVSRDNCKDILLEVVDIEGNKKGKPLQKWLPIVQNKQHNIQNLRFTMNDFSIKPIDVKLLKYKIVIFNKLIKL